MNNTGSSSGAAVWVVALIAMVVAVGLFRFVLLGGVALLGLVLIGLPLATAMRRHDDALTKVLASELMEHLVRHLVGQTDVTKALVFDGSASRR